MGAWLPCTDVRVFIITSTASNSVAELVGDPSFTSSLVGFALAELWDLSSPPLLAIAWRSWGSCFTYLAGWLWRRDGAGDWGDGGCGGVDNLYFLVMRIPPFVRRTEWRIF